MKLTRLPGLALPLVFFLGCQDPQEPDPPPSPPSQSSTDTPAVKSPGPVRLSEICPANLDLVDQFGEDPGWIELSNDSKDTVDLGLYQLRARAKDGKPWRLPALRLAPGAKQVIFASGRDLATESSPKDSIAPAITGSSRWADNQADPPGKSQVRAWEFGTGKYTGKLSDGTTGYSWTLILGDNGSMGWASAEAVVRFAPVDLAGRDRAWIRATIPAGQQIMVGLCQADAQDDCWKVAQTTLTGTGKPLDIYEFPTADYGPDQDQSSGLRFTPPKNLVGEFKLTFAGLGFYRSGSHPHASFKLQRDGGPLVLEDTALRTRDSVEYPKLLAGATYSRDSADGRWLQLASGSPGRVNPHLDLDPITAKVKFATKPGFQSRPFRLATDSVPGLAVRCAFGGAFPDPHSARAEAGIALDSSAAATCAAFAPDGRHGPWTFGTFFLEEAPRLAVVSITVDSLQMFSADSGITSPGPNASAQMPHFGANYWKETEIPAHVEMFDAQKRTFATRAGLSIFGNWSRASPKKSFYVQFKEKYGENKIETPLFPSHPELVRFKSFGLRNNGGNFWRDHVRDPLMERLAEVRDVDHQQSRHVLVYVNGRYFGLYQLVEKLDADWVETHHGTDPATVDLIKNNSEVQAGSIADWTDVRRTLEALAPDDEAGWANMAKRLDLDETMDYLALEMYLQNTDWPANNARCWRTNAPVSPWRMMMFDMDFGLGSEENWQSDPFTRILDTSTDWDAYPTGTGSTVVARRILGRKPLRDRFVNRALVQVATNLSEGSIVHLLDSMQAYIGTEAARDIALWGMKQSEFDKSDRTIRTFAANRPAAFRSMMSAALGLGAETKQTLSARGGNLLLEGIPVGESWTAFHFGAAPLRVQAVPPSGKLFDSWSDGVTTALRTVVPGTDSSNLEARFR